MLDALMIYKCNMQELERAKVIVSRGIETAPKRKKSRNDRVRVKLTVECLKGVDYVLSC